MPPAERWWEVDALRGLAVVMMVFYHAVWDLSFFGFYPSDVAQGNWRLFAWGTATLFFVLVGVSIVLAAQRRYDLPARHWMLRGLKVLAWALVISLVTRPLFGNRFIAFGALHFIGCALLCAPLLLRYQRRALLVAFVLLAAGFAAGRIKADTPWFLPLGIEPRGYAAVDYYPLLPWLSAVAAGIEIGRRYVPLRCDRLALPSSPPVWLAPLSALGRRSLLIYLMHQPFLFFLLRGVAALIDGTETGM